MNNEQLRQQQITPPVTEQPVQITGETAQVMPQMPADVANVVKVHNPGQVVDNLEPHVAPFVQHSGEATPVQEAKNNLLELNALRKKDKEINTLSGIFVKAAQGLNPWNKPSIQELRAEEEAHRAQRKYEQLMQEQAKMSQGQPEVEQAQPVTAPQSIAEQPVAPVPNNVVQFSTQNIQEGGLEHAA